jgi:hypothetical protein
VETESLQPSFEEDDLIIIAPPGYIHFELLKNITYLSTVSEDTYFRQSEVATKIRNNMVGDGAFYRFTRESAISTSKLLVDYLDEYYRDFFMASERVIAMEHFTPYKLISSIKEYIDKLLEENPDLAKHERIIIENPPGTHVRATVTNIQSYGLFVEIGLEYDGYISKSEFGNIPQSYIDCFQEGDLVEAEVIEFNKNHRRFSLRLLEIL